MTAEEALGGEHYKHWYKGYHAFIRRISSHALHVRSRLFDAIQARDELLARALKLALMSALGALVKLHMLLAPHVDDARTRMLGALSDCIVLMRTLCDRDYPFMDPIVSVRIMSLLRD